MAEYDVKLMYLPKIKVRIEPDTYVEVYYADEEKFFIGRISSVDPITVTNGVKHVCLQQYDVINRTDESLLERSFGGYSVNTRFSTYPCRLLKEVIVTTKFVEVPISEVSAICLLFTPSHLKEPSFNWCGGMMHCYILRYIARDNPNLPVMNTQGNPHIEHIPFPPISENAVDYSISRMEHIWNGLFEIHSNIQSMLSRWSEKQGHHPRFSKLIYFNAPNMFYYILNLCNYHKVTQPRIGYVKKSYILLTSGMKRHRQYGQKLHCTTLCFETKEQLNMLSQLEIGVSGRFGVRRRPPTLKDVHGQPLEPHYSLNYVLGSAAVESPYCQQTTKDGIDLTYMSSGHLRISVHSRRFLYSVDGKGIPKSCNCPVLMDMILFFPEKCIDSEDLSSTNVSGDSSDEDDDISVVSVADSPSEDSMFQPDTYFRHPETNKITRVTDKDLSVVTIDCGNDLSIDVGQKKKFPTILMSALEFLTIIANVEKPFY